MINSSRSCIVRLAPQSLTAPPLPSPSPHPGHPSPDFIPVLRAQLDWAALDAIPSRRSEPRSILLLPSRVADRLSKWGLFIIDVHNVALGSLRRVVVVRIEE